MKKGIKTMKKQRCCWCGTLKKRGVGKSSMLSASGFGHRFYWNCGCLDNYSFHEFTERLFEEGKNYPDSFKGLISRS